jgi:hypothetical protein
MVRSAHRPWSWWPDRRCADERLVSGASTSRTTGDNCMVVRRQLSSWVKREMKKALELTVAGHGVAAGPSGAAARGWVAHGPSREREEELR